MSKKLFLLSLGLALALSAAAPSSSFAQSEGPNEGQITRIDPEAKMITVKDELGDEWDLFWSESTKTEGTASLLELRPGDFVQFDYKDKEGRKVLLEIRRSSKARWLKLVGDMTRLV
jgi:Cu/Ag efflux protein CusF